jgi:dipeptidyl aminopeptidase/acylaminoacyl peptidase
MIDQAYGTWDSPIHAELTVQKAKRFGGVEIHGGRLYWEEMRPEESGRTVIVSLEGDCIPEGYSSCSRVHEYGGKSFTVHQDQIYFVNDKDQCIYANTRILTPPGARYADLLYTPSGLIAVKEQNGVHSLVLINLTDGSQSTLASGADFYASCALSPDHKQLCWLSWNLPDMPWDATELWLADWSEGTLSHARCIAGSVGESIFQPQWGPDGHLYCVSDQSGFWNLYRFNNHALEPLCEMPAEFGLPQWQFGMSTYAFLDCHTIVCTYSSTLALLDIPTKQLTPISISGTHFEQIRAENGTIACIKSSPTQPTALIAWKSNKERIIASNPKPDIDSGYFSIPESIAFPSAHGRTAYGFYYPPANKDYRGLKNTLPPLIVKIHGGPTARATDTFSLATQFWTSRGFAVLDVNYGGSTGYGRAFRELLYGKWGIVDVEDCEYGARYLVENQCVDPSKLAITGRSAGGFTVLSALTFGTVFTAGSSYYGVSDPVLLAQETHKFEEKYLDRLIGPYPERSDLYEARSPRAHVRQLKRPVIFFHGAQDKVVPLDQAEILYNALKEQGITTELVIYPEEKHGFKKAESLIDALNRELAFYLRVF